MKLIEGVHRFRRQEFGRYRELFHRLAREGQRPHTLFLTCSDSRVIAELITHSKPGDLFVVKNVGNIVPPAGTLGGPNSTAAAIEYALECLPVEDIVICGHSQCGAMTALLHGLESPETTPHLVPWLELAAPVKKLIREEYGYLTEPEYILTAAAEENVLFGIENLETYPAVRSRLESGKLHLHAWFFKIATGELSAYDPDLRQFTPLHAGE